MNAMTGGEIERIAARVRRCTLCRLSKGRKHAVPGEGPCQAKIMLIGQAPGRNKDATGRPFVGMAGKFLNKLLERNGIERRKAFITSTVKCFPPRNRIPKNDEIEACNPYLRSQIRLVKPKLVVLMGNVAIGAVLGKGFVKGKQVKREGIIFLPTYHPAAAMRFLAVRRRMESELSQIKRHLP
jgi:uracil-DNA glycosylase family 4